MKVFEIQWNGAFRDQAGYTLRGAPRMARDVEFEIRVRTDRFRVLFQRGEQTLHEIRPAPCDDTFDGFVLPPEVWNDLFAREPVSQLRLEAIGRPPFDNCDGSFSVRAVLYYQEPDVDRDENGVADACEASSGLQRPGDCNQDGVLGLSDAICVLGYLFLGSPARLPCGGGGATEPGNRALLDSNGDGSVGLADAVHELYYLYLGGPAPVLGTQCARIEDCASACKQ